jgi:hypothetical protein
MLDPGRMSTLTSRSEGRTMDRQLATDQPVPSLLDVAMSDLTRCQHDHERYYISAPRERAAVLQRHAHALLELADQLSTSTPAEASTSFEALKRDLWLIGDAAEENGAWLEAAMETSWDAATSLIALDELADVIGERHRIIANDWQAALTAWLPNCCGEPSRFSLPWSSTRSSRGTGPRRPLRRAASRARRRSSGAPPHCSTTPPSSAMTMNGAGLSSEATCATS